MEPDNPPPLPPTFGEVLFAAQRRFGPASDRRAYDRLPDGEIEAYELAARAVLDAYRAQATEDRNGWADIDGGVTHTMIRMGFAALDPYRVGRLHDVTGPGLRSVYLAMAAARGGTADTRASKADDRRQRNVVVWPVSGVWPPSRKQNAP